MNINASKLKETEKQQSMWWQSESTEEGEEGEWKEKNKIEEKVDMDGFTLSLSTRLLFNLVLCWQTRYETALSINGEFIISLSHFLTKVLSLSLSLNYFVLLPFHFLHWHRNTCTLTHARTHIQTKLLIHTHIHTSVTSPPYRPYFVGSHMNMICNAAECSEWSDATDFSTSI